jgi:hypothetical protein
VAIVRRFYTSTRPYFARVRVFPEAPVPACPMENIYGQIVRVLGAGGLAAAEGWAVRRRSSSARRRGCSLSPSWRQGNRKKKKKKLISLLVTSFLSDYYERIRGVYFKSPTATGEYVEVHHTSPATRQGAGHGEDNQS